MHTDFPLFSFCYGIECCCYLLTLLALRDTNALTTRPRRFGVAATVVMGVSLRWANWTMSWTRRLATAWEAVFVLHKT